MKISDFGTSKEWNEISTKMSFAGTVSWMAPEVIRNEPCSEKVDIWSYGVVLWELLTCEIPYKDVDSSAIIWGIGNNSLQLPIPSTCPEGFKLLIKQCWSPKPRNRPPFKIIMTHLEIAGVELLQNFDDTYYEQQKSWREEIREHLETCTTNGTNIHKYEDDLIRKRQDEWKHAKDIRLIYERKLERTNNLYMELSACFMQLEEREREIAEREKQMGTNKPYRKIVNQLRKHQFDKIGRRRLPQSPASLEVNSTTVSPVSTPSSPVKATLYAQLEGLQTKSIVVQPTSGNSSMRAKKMRHRRSGSGSLQIAPKSSPTRDRRVQSEPETRGKLVDTETQTDCMDISETDGSPVTTPNPIVDAIETKTPTTTRHPVTLCLRTDENNKQFVTVIKKSQSATLNSSSSEDEGDIDDNVPQEDTSSSQTTNNLMMTNSMLTSIMTGSNLSYDSNEHLNNFRECSDDDHLDTLGRKVSELISETTSNISTVSSTSTVINKNQASASAMPSPSHHQNNHCFNCPNNNNNGNYATDSDNCKCIVNNNEHVTPTTDTNDNDKNLNNTKCCCSAATSNYNLCNGHRSSKDGESHEDGSWTDEEGEDPFDYSFSLRRKR